MAAKLTKPQRRMLELVRDWEGESTCEIECQWGDYDLGSENSTFWLTRLVTTNVLKALVRKGLIRECDPHDDGYELTEAGRKALEAK